MNVYCKDCEHIDLRVYCNAPKNVAVLDTWYQQETTRGLYAYQKNIKNDCNWYKSKECESRVLLEEGYAKWRRWMRFLDGK